MFKFIYKKRAQATLEMAIAVIGVFIILLGLLNTFVWINKRMVRRQQDYENTRVRAGNNQPGVQVNESHYPTLNILKRR